MLTNMDFDSEYENKWCPGCGNFPILSAMKTALVRMAIPPEKILLVSGIGQAGKTPHFLKCNMFHCLHGRALPVATGAKIANHELNIIVNSGDGDCYGEGGNHFLAAIRRNVDITLLVHNNQVYGLTKGQASPTSSLGMTTKIQNHGVISTPFNALAIALVTGAGFVARGFSGNEEQMVDLICQANAYKGFAMVEIMQPCVSFNKINTFGWYKQRVYDLTTTGHDPSSLSAALELTLGRDDKIPTGVYYQQETIPFHERISVLKDGPLMSRTFESTKLKKIIFDLA